MNGQSRGRHKGTAAAVWTLLAITLSGWSQGGGKLSHTEYVIGPADLLAVNVWRQPQLSLQAAVRPDGRITMPLIGELRAGGRTPIALAQLIAVRLARYLAQPRVTVSVVEVRSRSFNVLGRVMHAGAYPLSRSERVLDALALAGGFAPFAHKNRIYILRRKGTRQAVDYAAILAGQSPDPQLQPGDTLVVP